MHEHDELRKPLRIRPRENSPVHSTRIDTDEIFRELIAEEIRRGRLSVQQRKRIVRYAAQMGLSAVDAGKLVASCQQEAELSENPVVREHALRLVVSRERKPIAWPIRVLLALNVALAIHLVLRFLA